MDEAHQLANNMMSFHSLTVSQRMLEKLFRLPTQQDISNAKSERKKEEYRKQRETILKVFDGKGAFGIPKLTSMTLTTPPAKRKEALQTFGRYLFALRDEVKARMKDKDAQTKYDKRELSYASNCAIQIEDLLGSIATDWENWVYQVDENNEYPTWVGLKPLNVADYAEDFVVQIGTPKNNDVGNNP